MKPTWPAESTLSIPTLLMGDAVVYTIKQGCFSYADMLRVKVFMSMLYSSGFQPGFRQYNPGVPPEVT